MQKMFTTQITGLLKRMMDNEEQLEDGARLLAQAAMGEGAIYLKGFAEMEGIVLDALDGAEPLPYTQELKTVSALTHVDRVLLITRFSDDEKAVELGKELTEHGIPFVAISGNKKVEGDLAELADVFLDTHLIKPLLPTDNGRRTGFPSLIAASYLYLSLKFVIDEIIQEYS